MIMYKDKVKQKVANKAASQRRRDKAKGMTEPGYDADGLTHSWPAYRLACVARGSLPGDVDCDRLCPQAQQDAAQGDKSGLRV